MTGKEELIARALRDFMHKRLCEDFLEAEWYRTELEQVLYEAEFYTLDDYYSLDDSQRDILPQSAYLASLMSLLYAIGWGLVEETKYAESTIDVATRVSAIQPSMADEMQGRYENIARRSAEFGEWAGYTAEIFRLSKQLEKELAQDMKGLSPIMKDYTARQYPKLPLKPMDKAELDVLRKLNGNDKITVSRDIYGEIFRKGIKYEMELIEAYREFSKIKESANEAMKDAIKESVFDSAKPVFEKIATTETTAAMNKGSIDAGQTESRIGGYEFVAVMDNKTTEICRPRNGLILSKSDALLVAQNTPPLHYNCRSHLSALTFRAIALRGGESRLQSDREKFLDAPTFNWYTGKPD